LNLQEGGCKTVIHYDLHFNPTVIEQRVGRIYRGENRDPTKINVYSLILMHTYDERLHKISNGRKLFKDFILGEEYIDKFVNKYIENIE